MNAPGADLSENQTDEHAAIGLKPNVRHLAAVRTRALATGLAASVVLMTASLVLIKLLMYTYHPSCNPPIAHP